LQQVAIQANQQALAFRNASIELSNYLWNENGDNVFLPESILPEGTLAIMPNQELLPPNLVEVLQKTEQMHPELKQYPFKQQVLEIDKRLKFQELLPRVDLSYNHLAKGNYWLSKQTISPLMQNNYQYGLKISVPLRFSQGRGAYKEARLKIEELKWEQAQSITKFKNKVQSYYNDLINLNTQINLQKKQYNNNLTLQNAEEIRFLNGESSLFLINARESKALETYDKLIDLKVKYYKSYYGLQWSAGLLN
jgi:outer membrane protein TolC